MSKTNFPYALVACTLIFASCTVLLSQTSASGKRQALLAPPPEYIEQMHFGFASAVADSFWLRWIQDADTCYAYFGFQANLPQADQNREFFNPRHKKCDSSWGFKMLDAVTKLDPRFMMPYMAGAMALSVLVEDYEGATVIFDRGLQEYPNDWKLAYRASYHFLFDKNDLPRAAELLERASKNGGPEWFSSLAARLYTRSGQLELGLANLINYRKAFQEDSPGREDVDKRIAELKAELEREKSKR